jgi:hypothetical protein
MNVFQDIGPLVGFAKLRANRGLYDGLVNDRNMRLIKSCSHLLAVSPIESARLIYTRDVGHHSSGWWKNPEYERCLHLSISFCANPSNRPLPFRSKFAEKVARGFFGDDAAKAWIEPPYSAEGKICGVHHYRVFCDAGWNPILPRGEVYSRDNMPSGWRSFSEIHGYEPRPEDAPFLKAASK